MGTAQGAELACGDFLAKLGKKPAHFGCQSCQKQGAAQPEIDRFFVNIDAYAQDP